MHVMFLAVGLRFQAPAVAAAAVALAAAVVMVVVMVGMNWGGIVEVVGFSPL